MSDRETARASIALKYVAANRRKQRALERAVAPIPSPPAAPLDRLCTIREVADAAHVSDKMIYDRVQRGMIPCVRLGRIIRIKQSVLAKILQDGIGGHDGRV